MGNGQRIAWSPDETWLLTGLADFGIDTAYQIH
jgi:hypothetical protein